MKRVKAACLLQTLVFSQRPELGFNAEQALELNRAELASYKNTLIRSHTRHQILDAAEQEDGTIIVHVRKQYNEKTDVAEYFV